MNSEREVSVESVVCIDAYAVIARAVEEGVLYGWTRAHKHTEHPNKEQICESMVDEALNALCEVLRFEPGAAGCGAAAEARLSGTGRRLTVPRVMTDIEVYCARCGSALRPDNGRVSAVLWIVPCEHCLNKLIAAKEAAKDPVPETWEERGT